MSHITGLTIRQYSREAVELPIEFIVSDEHTTQVRLSSTGSATHEQAITGFAVDISSGGMGLVTDHYLPRMCKGIVRVFSPGSNARSEDAALRKVVFEHLVKVRRTSMSSHDPTYLVGVSFLQPEADLAQQIERIKTTFGNGNGETTDA